MSNSATLLKHTNMKSRISIEIDFDNGQPYIKVLEDSNSDDVRDKLITFLRQRLGGHSCWFEMGSYGTHEVNGQTGINKWTIHAITPDKIVELKKHVDATVEYMKTLPEPSV